MGEQQTAARQAEDRWIIRVRGDLTREQESLLFDLCPWQRDVTDPVRHILFDMDEQVYINSAGIALLIRFARDAAKRGYTICACGLSAHYQKIFKIVGLTSYMETFADVYSAQETLKSRAAHGE